MMERDESAALASAILEGAGWRAINSNVMAGRYVVGDLVGGTDPKGESHIKNVSAIKPGDPRYGPDTPDEPHEAAQWLVDRFKAQQAANALHTETVLAPPRIVLDEPEELAEDSGDEAHTQDAPSDPVTADEDCADESPTDESAASGHSILAGGFDETWGPAETEDGGRDNAPEGPIDADFSEPAPELGQELAEEHPEEFGGAAFIFGDNLDQRRTAAIGMVMQAALRRLPAAIDYAQLSELRNFTMGVSEGRFADSPAKRDELDALEEIERTRRKIEKHRDNKVAGLMSATREEIEAFDPEAGWPQ